MAITTGSVLQGLVNGLDKGVTGSATGAPNSLVYVTADPDGTIPALGSQVAQDVANDEFYMCETDGNTDWIHLGSTSAP